MPWPFDPVAMREELAVCRDGEWVARHDRLAMAAAARIPHTTNDAANALIAGLPRVAEELARRALASPEALKVSVPSGTTNANYREYFLRSAESDAVFCQALLSWVIRGVLPLTEVGHALGLKDTARESERRWSRQRMDTVALDDYMLTAILANADERALLMFRTEDKVGRKPVEIRSARSERTVAAALAESRLAGRRPDEPTRAALDRLISSRITPWLGGGRPRQLLAWLIVRGNFENRQRSPVDVALDAYEFMPDVERPARV